MKTLILILLSLFLAACTTPTTPETVLLTNTAVPTNPPYPTAPRIENTDYPAEPFPPHIEAIEQFQRHLGLPASSITFLEMTIMVNSPSGDLPVASYQDSEGRIYFVELITNQVVEMDARNLLRSISLEALAYGPDDLLGQAETILALTMTDFASQRGDLTDFGGVKENLYFFDWRAPSIPGLMNRPFVQIGIHETGLVFAYINTLGFE